MNVMGSPHMGHSGGGPLSMTGSSGSSKSSSIIGQSFPLLTRFHFEQQGFLGALPARDADKREPPIDNSGWYRPHRMPVGEASSILRRDVHLAIAEAILRAQLLPQALCRWAGSTARRD